MSGAIALFDFITENHLEATFSKSVKLLKVLITIPMTTSKAERCFPYLKRIKTFLRNTMGLAMLSIDFNNNFNNKVIDKFGLSF